MRSVQITVRPGRPDDLEHISRIQAASPEAAGWSPGAWLVYDCLVAETRGQAAGFLVSRKIDEGEVEILNLAVAPEWRRRGVATLLLRQILTFHDCRFFLEVRQSNTGARCLYRKLGFEEAGIRPRYYTDPVEDGIVMRFQSC